jgi:hypothetical protein
MAENIQQLQFPKKLIEGCKVGQVVEVSEHGQVLVDFPGNLHGPLTARLTGSVKAADLRQAANSGCELLLSFVNGDPEQPIVVDTLHARAEFAVPQEPPALQTDEPQDVTIDGRRITFDAKEEVVLRCGRASITLTKAGKILIRGAYLLTRSSGVNRIKGGSVQIN